MTAQASLSAPVNPVTGTFTSNGSEFLRSLSQELANVIGSRDAMLFHERFGSVRSVLHSMSVKNDALGPPEMEHAGIDVSTIASRRASCGTAGALVDPAGFLWKPARWKKNWILISLLLSSMLSIVLGAFMGFLDIFEGLVGLLSIGLVASVKEMYRHSHNRPNFVFHRQVLRYSATVYRYREDPTSSSPLPQLLELRVPMGSLVVGDVVKLSSGMTLPFDALLLRSELPMTIQEPSCVGETVKKAKCATRDFFLVGGSTIAEESCDGIAVVCAVGSISSVGSRYLSTNSTKSASFVHQQLNDLAYVILSVGLMTVMVSGVIVLVKSLTGLLSSPLSLPEWLLSILTDGVTIIAATVPKGLYLAVTLSSVCSALRMSSDGIVVYRLEACSTIGDVSTVCVSKSGVLTKPRMVATQLLLSQQEYPIKSSDLLQNMSISWEPGTIQLLTESIAWASKDHAAGTLKGASAEALLSIPLRFHSSLSPILFEDDVATAAHRISTSGLDVCQFPAGSQMKVGASFVSSGSELICFLYGPAEHVLRRTTHLWGSDSTKTEMTPSIRQFHGEYTKGRRTIAFAYAECDPSHSFMSCLSDCKFCLLGLAVLEEQLQDGAPAVVNDCRRANIRVILVTEDALFSSIRTAKGCGLLSERQLLDPCASLDGPSFRTLSDQAIIGQYMPVMAVFAEATASDKERFYRLLSAFQPSGTIAIVGDEGIDVPLLSIRHVSCQLASAGRFTSRVPDIVLKKNWPAFMKAVAVGRSLKYNIRFFLQYQLTVNFGACLTALCVALLESFTLPVKQVQLLWMSFFVDIMAAAALCTEKTEVVMTDGPHENSASSIVTATMWVGIAVQIAFQLVVQLTLNSYGRMLLSGSRELSIVNDEVDDNVFSTFLFNIFTWMQVCNYFNARLLDKSSVISSWYHNKVLRWVVAGVAVAQYAVVQHGGTLMSTEPLTVSEWLWSLLIGGSALVGGKLSRWVSSQYDDPNFLLVRYVSNTLFQLIQRMESQYNHNKV